MAEPDLCAFFDELTSAYGWDWSALSVAPGIASGLLTGTNPPYTATDFLGFYPKFGGTPSTIQGTLTSGSATVTSTVTSGLSAGQLIAAPGIPAGTTIQSVDSDTKLTLSQNATATGTQQLTVYVAPFVPLVVINAYIALATASLQQVRWQDSWTIGMALFIGHFLTLYLRSDGDMYSTAGQAAAAGLNVGITVSKAAGPVSQGLQLVQGLDSWAAWNMTSYGIQFATMAKCIGAGPIFVP